MGKRGPKPKGKVKIAWSPQFAYAIGLLVSDGNLSPNGRHINFTTTDVELIELFQSSLAIIATVTVKRRGAGEVKKCYAVQFGDVLFYNFLLQVGLTPKKSKTIGIIDVPPKYFFDFLRGVFDGDGSTHSYFDKRWKNSFMFYTIFASASEDFIEWLRSQINQTLALHGHVTRAQGHSVIQLKYAKTESLVLLQKMYQNQELPSLTRKRLKIDAMLRIIGESL